MTSRQRDAIQKWVTSALPVMPQDCVSCHDGSRADVGFLAGNGAIAMHDTLMAFQPPVVNLDAASSS